MRRCRKVILYSPQNCAKRNITRRKPNITAKQYNSPQANITEKSAFAYSKRRFLHGAEDGNRTHTICLGSRSSATKLLPLVYSVIIPPFNEKIKHNKQKSLVSGAKIFFVKKVLTRRSLLPGFSVLTLLVVFPIPCRNNILNKSRKTGQG